MNWKNHPRQTQCGYHRIMSVRHTQRRVCHGQYFHDGRTVELIAARIIQVTLSSIMTYSQSQYIITEKCCTSFIYTFVVWEEPATFIDASPDAPPP